MVASRFVNYYNNKGTIGLSKGMLLKGQAAVGPTVKSGQWQAPRINRFSELSQVMSRSVTDCKHAGCWNQLIYWNVCTFVVEDDW